METEKKFKIDMDFVRGHLKESLPEGDNDTSQSASDAARGLDAIKSFFYGTPLEEVITEMIEFCDEVSTLTEE